MFIYIHFKAFLNQKKTVINLRRPPRSQVGFDLSTRYSTRHKILHCALDIVVLHLFTTNSSSACETYIIRRTGKVAECSGQYALS